MIEPEEIIYNDEFTYRERANTWPSVLKVGGVDDFRLSHQQRTEHDAFSPNSQCSSRSRLSLISESNETVNTSSLHDDARLSHAHQVNNFNISASSVQQQATKRSSPSVPNYKAGHPSYVELITSAILSSPEKRMTLSEVYDWMVVNVPAFKDQRHLHSSAGWKNSVRHNLSLHSRFKRVKRNGMDKPSWWTVDLTEQSKDRRKARNGAAGRARSNTTPSGVGRRDQLKIESAQGATMPMWNASVSQPNMQTFMTPQQPSFANALGARTTSGGMLTDPFVPQVATLNHNDLMDMCSYKYEPNKILQQQHEQIIRDPNAHRLSMSSTFDETDSAFASNTSLEAMEMSGNGNAAVNLHKFAQVITVTLRDQAIHASADGKNDYKPEIALRISGGDLAGLTSKQASVIQQQLSIPAILSRYLRPSSAEDSRQILRVNTNAGSVQDVAVPAPLPIRVVINSDKQCQTEDLEMEFVYGLQLNSPTTMSTPVTQTSNEADKNGLDQRHQMQSQSGTVAMPGGNHLIGTPVENMNISLAGVLSEQLAERSHFSQATSGVSGLPEDLATLNVEGDVDCNIMDVLSYDMRSNFNSSNNVDNVVDGGVCGTSSFNGNNNQVGGGEEAFWRVMSI